MVALLTTWRRCVILGLTNIKQVGVMTQQFQARGVDNGAHYLEQVLGLNRVPVWGKDIQPIADRFCQHFGLPPVQVTLDSTRGTVHRHGTHWSAQQPRPARIVLYSGAGGNTLQTLVHELAHHLEAVPGIAPAGLGNYGGHKARFHWAHMEALEWARMCRESGSL